MKKIINSSGAPAAVGPYSQAVEAGGTLYISGQLPLDPENGTIDPTIEGQTRRCLKNIEAILTEAGYTRGDVVKSTVLLDDISNFGAMNAEYAAFYNDKMPARVCYEVSKLPMGVKVEIETIAVRDTHG